jgi:hypothetical protein
MSLRRQAASAVALILWMVFPSLLSASDLFLEGTLAGGSYISDEGIVARNGCTIAAGVRVEAIAAYETVLRPGTRVQAGGRLVVKIRDNDGLPNRWEMAHFKSLEQGPGDDYDGDRLTNLEEYVLGLNPVVDNPDNDADGMADWWEVRYFGLNLQNGSGEDFDQDGTSNFDEYQYDTDPRDPGSRPRSVMVYEYDDWNRIRRIVRSLPVKVR